MVSINERLKEAVRDIIEKPLQSEGCELADLSISQYKKGSTVRLFVYCENGVTVGKCASLSSLIGAVIDGTELFVNGYTLEISSPGLDRPFSFSKTILLSLTDIILAFTAGRFSFTKLIS